MLSLIIRQMISNSNSITIKTGRNDAWKKHKVAWLQGRCSPNTAAQVIILLPPLYHHMLCSSAMLANCSVTYIQSMNPVPFIPSKSIGLDH